MVKQSHVVSLSVVESIYKLLVIVNNLIFGLGYVDYFKSSVVIVVVKYVSMRNKNTDIRHCVAEEL